MHPSSNSLNLPEIEKIGIPRKISSISLYDQASFGYAQDSILPSISKFVNTINAMSHIIMIPSKLHDFECEQESDLNDTKSISSDDGSLSSSSSVSSNLTNLANSNPENSNLTNGTTTLYDSYRMLMQAQTDLLWGFKEQHQKQQQQTLDQNNNLAAKEENKDDEIVDNQIITQFRNNIQQLNTLLNNFSEMAEFLTNKYQTVYEN